MNWEQVKKEGAPFTFERMTFYDFGAGPQNRRAVVCGPVVLDRRYGFAWFYNPDNPVIEKREDVAKILVNQFRFSLIDHRWELLKLGKLSAKGEEIDFDPDPPQILLSSSNVACSDREYAVAS